MQRQCERSEIKLALRNDDETFTILRVYISVSFLRFYLSFPREFLQTMSKVQTGLRKKQQPMLAKEIIVFFMLLIGFITPLEILVSRGNFVPKFPIEGTRRNRLLMLIYIYIARKFSFRVFFLLLFLFSSSSSFFFFQVVEKQIYSKATMRRRFVGSFEIPLTFALKRAELLPL